MRDRLCGMRESGIETAENECGREDVGRQRGEGKGDDEEGEAE